MLLDMLPKFLGYVETDGVRNARLAWIEALKMNNPSAPDKAMDYQLRAEELDVNKTFEFQIALMIMKALVWREVGNMEYYAADLDDIIEASWQANIYAVYRAAQQARDQL